MSWIDFAIAIGVTLLTEELLGWVDQLAKWLVRHNARQAPENIVARLEEEWLACLANIPGKITKLLFALDCRRAAYIVSHQARLPHISPLASIRVRVFDLIGSLFVIAVCAPTCILAAVAIRLSGRGPILLRQERVGLGGHLFCILKFRTMTVNGGAMTQIGRILRWTRIDELPQMLNVLRGEMSFVGPQPERPHYVNTILAHIPDYDLRHSIKPGITGFAQISSYSRAPMPDIPGDDPIQRIKERLENDLFFIRNYNLTFVIELLFKTVGVVLWGAKPQSHVRPEK